jgi:hypothetical protein
MTVTNLGEILVSDTIELIPTLEEAKEINWLLSVVCKDGTRPILSCLHSRADYITETCNGWSLHQAPTIEPFIYLHLENKLLMPDRWKAVKGEPINFHILDSVYTFPDTDKIIPASHEIRFQITVDIKLLSNALQVFSGGTKYDFKPGLRNKVTISGIGPNKPLLIEDVHKHRALIMPTYKG